MQALIVYNPKSGLWSRLNINLVDLIKKKLARQCKKVEIFELKDWSGRIFEKYKNEKFDLIISIGGDGTARTCATLILDHMPQACLKIIPVGSNNSLASSLKINPSALVNVAKLGKIHKLKKISIDVGQLNEKEYFLGTLALGYAAYIISKTQQAMKNRFGFAGYVLTYLKHRQMPVYDFELNVDGKKHYIQASTLVIVNALNILGFSAGKKVNFYDGVFDIFYISYNTFWKFLLNVSAFFLLPILPTKRIGHLTGKQIKLIQKDKKTLASVQIDGDTIKTKTFLIRVLPKALKILI